MREIIRPTSDCLVEQSNEARISACSRTSDALIRIKCDLQRRLTALKPYAFHISTCLQHLDFWPIIVLGVVVHRAIVISRIIFRTTPIGYLTGGGYKAEDSTHE